MPVQVRVCVLNRGERSAWVFATGGLAWPPLQVARRYRARFGIESSYRQLGQVLAATTSKDVRVRLLLVGLALLLRQYACLLEQEQGPAGRGGRVRLAELAVWLILELARVLDFRHDSPQAPESPPLTAA